MSSDNTDAPPGMVAAFGVGLVLTATSTYALYLRELQFAGVVLALLVVLFVGYGSIQATG